MSRSAKSRSGMTLLEVAIVLTILSLLAINVTMVSKTGSQVASSGAFFEALNDEADTTLDRISLALMSSSSADLYPVKAAPGFSDYMDYTVSLGLQGGEIVLGPVERIAWEPNGPGGQVAWYSDLGGAEERTVVWSRAVPDAFDGEVLGNGIDDNANGINEESGLAFVKNGELVDVHLTVEGTAPDGNQKAIRRIKKVHVRN